eukprot:NODE_1092_length_1103_cov_120.144213_g839_i0.p1 GENE.NODE_1092_length_1103_cov_120.144213_g839_i0~~NODE_1092_length_1103_cov_120.144213_g839_i0.p1  ORF type:complete len:234 (+),score=50.27 NODE_1092_length_1103_cov_120.144213_g839_i0:146-847(+)
MGGGAGKLSFAELPHRHPLSTDYPAAEWVQVYIHSSTHGSHKQQIRDTNGAEVCTVMAKDSDALSVPVTTAGGSSKLMSIHRTSSLNRKEETLVVETRVQVTPEDAMVSSGTVLADVTMQTHFDTQQQLGRGETVFNLFPPLQIPTFDIYTAIAFWNARQEFIVCDLEGEKVCVIQNLLETPQTITDDGHFQFQFAVVVSKLKIPRAEDRWAFMVVLAQMLCQGPRLKTSDVY